MKEIQIMSPRELMVGDWVNGKPYVNGTQEAFRVYQIEEAGYAKHGFFHVKNTRRGSAQFMDGGDIEPIPLTVEILKKNGFYAYGNYPNRYFCNKDEIYCVAVIRDGIFSKFCVMSHSEFEPFDAVFIADCRYVHLLQHALRLVGLGDIAENFKI